MPATDSSRYQIDPASVIRIIRIFRKTGRGGTIKIQDGLNWLKGQVQEAISWIKQKLGWLGPRFLDATSTIVGLFAPHGQGQLNLLVTTDSGQTGRLSSGAAVQNAKGSFYTGMVNGSQAVIFDGSTTFRALVDASIAEAGIEQYSLFSLYTTSSSTVLLDAKDATIQKGGQKLYSSQVQGDNFSLVGACTDVLCQYGLVILAGAIAFAGAIVGFAIWRSGPFRKAGVRRQTSPPTQSLGFVRSLSP